MANSDVQYNLRTQESKLNKMNNQIGSQQRILNLRDDPLGAGRLVRYQSYLTRLERFEKNAQTLTDQYSVAEGYMNQSLQIMQRIRELAVQGASGTYTPEDLKNMSGEVDELLKELVQNGNAIGPDGTRLFAGTRNDGDAFEIVMGDVPGASDAMIKQVRYNGTIDTNSVEVDELAYMDMNRAGNRIFWAEQQQLFSPIDATAYQVPADTSFSVDGREIKVAAGDNVYSIIAKINDSGAAVKAYLDPVTRGLNIETTDARQLWLEDLGGGRTLTDLGIIKDSSQRPPYNLSDSVKVAGGSLFDSVIALRDAMIAGDHESIGGRVLGSLDGAVSNLSARLAEAGSQYERAQANLARHSVNILNVNSHVSREGDLDFTQAITDLKMLEYVHQAGLSTAAQLYSNSLLNYLR